MEDTDVKCIYCKSRCNITNGSVGSLYPTSVFSDYFCTNEKCSEVFHFSYYETEPIEIIFFTFSCNGIFVQLIDKYCVIGNNLLIWEYSPNDFEQHKIPLFNIDFSEKEKLYNKLKSYLVFA